MAGPKSVLALICTLFLVQAKAADNCLRIGIATTPSVEAIQAGLTQKIFERAQFCVELIRVPQNRINVMEQSGELDGDAARVEDYVATTPYLIHVPTPVLWMTVSLIWPAAHDEPSEPGRLIGSFLGAFWTKQMAAQLGATLYEVPDYDQLFHMVGAGRVAEVIISEEMFKNLSDQGRLNATDWHLREAGKVPLFLTINRRYADLIPSLDAAIASLVKDGIISSFPMTGGIGRQ